MILSASLVHSLYVYMSLMSTIRVHKITFMYGTADVVISFSLLLQDIVSFLRAELSLLRRHTCQTKFPRFTLAEKLCIVSLVYNITFRMRSHNFGINFCVSWISYLFTFPMIHILGLHFLKDASTLNFLLLSQFLFHTKVT